jgi:hypothetical protein
MYVLILNSSEFTFLRPSSIAFRFFSNRNARRMLSEPILEHLCRIDATYAEVQQILGIANVNAFTQKLWQMTFSEAKSFFQSHYIGNHEFDYDLPPF